MASYNTSLSGGYTTGTYTIDSVDWAGATVSAKLVTTEGSKQLNTHVKVVQVKAGYLGQVVTSVPSSFEIEVLWESKPKKTTAKAQKAAQKAQLEAARSTFDWIEA